MIVVKLAGISPPKVEKRAAESIVYTLDCSELLEKNEVITSIDLINDYPSTIVYSDIRSRLGKHIEVRIDNTPIGTSQYVDFNTNVFFYTNFKNKKLAVFTVRVYK